MNHLIWVSLLGTRHKRTIAMDKILHLGPGRSEPVHISFFTWDRGKVNHFTWVSLLGTHHEGTTSYEFLFLGHVISEPLHMSFFIWNTLQVNHVVYEFLYLGFPKVNNFIWIRPCGHPTVNELMWASLLVLTKRQNPRGANTGLRGRISWVWFWRSVISSLQFLKGHLQNDSLGNVQQAWLTWSFLGWGRHSYHVQKGLPHLQPLSCFSIRSIVHLVQFSAKSTCLAWYLFWAGADMAKCLLSESSGVGHIFKSIQNN